MNFTAYMRKIRRMILYRIIIQLDKLDKWCWADLVTWADGIHKFEDVSRIGGCISPYGDGPWCGKCEKFLPPENRFENVRNPVWDSEKCIWVEEGAKS